MSEQSLDFKMVFIPQPIFEGNNVFRIGDLLIDTGHVDDGSQAVLRQQLQSGELKGVKEVIITHPHVDHVTASAVMPELAEIPHTLLAGAERMTGNLNGYLRGARDQQINLFPIDDPMLREVVQASANVYFPGDLHYGKVNIARLVKDGEEIDVGRSSLRAVYTPGHEDNHMALFHEASGTLFAGDVVTNNGYFSCAPPSPNIAKYEASLKRLSDLHPRLIVPSHGTVISDGPQHLEKCLSNLESMKRKVMEVLEKHEEVTPLQAAEEIIRIADPLRIRVLAFSVFVYLAYFEEQGKIALDRDRLVARLL